MLKQGCAASNILIWASLCMCSSWVLRHLINELGINEYLPTPMRHNSAYHNTRTCMQVKNLLIPVPAWVNTPQRPSIFIVLVLCGQESEAAHSASLKDSRTHRFSIPLMGLRWVRLQITLPICSKCCWDVAPGFKNKTRHTPYVNPESQISHIATNQGNIKRQYLLHNVLVKRK